MYQNLFLYPPSAPEESINVLKLMQADSFLLDKKQYMASILMTGSNSFFVVALSEFTGGIAIISISEEQTGIDKIIADRLKEFIESNPKYTKKNIQVFSYSFMPEEINDISIWGAIAEGKTEDIVFESAFELLPEFSDSNNKLPPLETEIAHFDNIKGTETDIKEANHESKIIHIPATSQRMMDSLTRILKRTIQNTVGNHDITIRNEPIPLDDLVHTKGYLGALLIHAAIYWAPIMKMKSDKPGFRIHLKTDNSKDMYGNPSTTLGYDVIAIDVDNVPLFAIPVGEIIKRSQRTNQKGETIFDIIHILESSAAWLFKYNHKIDDFIVFFEGIDHAN